MKNLMTTTALIATLSAGAAFAQSTNAKSEAIIPQSSETTEAGNAASAVEEQAESARSDATVNEDSDSQAMVNETSEASQGADAVEAELDSKRDETSVNTETADNDGGSGITATAPAANATAQAEPLDNQSSRSESTVNLGEDPQPKPAMQATEEEKDDVASSRSESNVNEETSARAPEADEETAPDNARYDAVTGEGSDSEYVTAETVEESELQGARVYDANDEWIGEISEVFPNSRTAIVDVGGFLGIGEKPVELNLSDLNILKSEEGSDLKVMVRMTEAQLEAMPTYAN